MLIKLTISLFMLLSSLVHPVAPYKIEIDEPSYDFVVETDTHEATLMKVHVGINDRLDVDIPPFIHWYNRDFVVTRVSEGAFDGVEKRIDSVRIPETLRKDGDTKKAFDTVINNSLIPITEKMEIKEYFEPEKE